jgi:signal transduction histidine kinase
VSLSERLTFLNALRILFATLALGVVVSSPGLRPSLVPLTLMTVAYASTEAALEGVRRLLRARSLTVIGIGLLVDGVYLSWVVYATGGLQSPLRFVILGQVVAVTLLGSYLTGIKLAAWYSLLTLTASFAQEVGLVPIRESSAAAVPGGGDFALASMLAIGALWVVTLVAAACSAFTERELRRQKVDLEQLSRMVGEIDRRSSASDIPRVLVDELCDGFGVRRAAVLGFVAHDDTLVLMAGRGVEQADLLPPGADPLMGRAWDQGVTQLVHRADPATDPRLAAFLPDGRNLLVVPLFVQRPTRLGILALEWPGRGRSVRRWVVDIVEQFASHAALALHNAWLLEEIGKRLEENQALQAELHRHNLLLESRVRERTHELEESLAELEAVDAQRRMLLSRLVDAEEDERRRIAADVHDGPVQLLVAASMQLQIVGKRLADGESPRHGEVDEVVSTLSDAIGGLRDLIFELRPLALDHEGLAPALRQLANRMGPGIETRVIDGLGAEPPEETRAIMYRIAQEALANIRKHARASSLEIALEERDGGHLIRIRDDGVGFRATDGARSAPGHLGLSSMRERSEMARGTFEIVSEPGRGTVVEAWLPSAAPGADPVARVAAVGGSRSPEFAERPQRALRVVRRGAP